MRSVLVLVFAIVVFIDTVRCQCEEEDLTGDGVSYEEYNIIPGEIYCSGTTFKKDGCPVRPNKTVLESESYYGSVINSKHWIALKKLSQQNSAIIFFHLTIGAKCKDKKPEEVTAAKEKCIELSWHDNSSTEFIFKKMNINLPTNWASEVQKYPKSILIMDEGKLSIKTNESGSWNDISRRICTYHRTLVCGRMQPVNSTVFVELKEILVGNRVRCYNKAVTMDKGSKCWRRDNIEGGIVPKADLNLPAIIDNRRELDFVHKYFQSVPVLVSLQSNFVGNSKVLLWKDGSDASPDLKGMIFEQYVDEIIDSVPSAGNTTLLVHGDKSEIVTEEFGKKKVPELRSHVCVFHADTTGSKIKARDTRSFASKNTISATVTIYWLWHKCLYILMSRN